MSINDIDLWYLQRFMYSFSCLHLPDYNSFWKIHCFTFFPYKSRKDQIWSCRKKYQRSTHGYRLSKLGSTAVPDSIYQVSTTSADWIQRRRFLKIFTIYGHGGHLGHVTRIIWAYFFRSLIPVRLHVKFDFDWPSSFWGDVWRVWTTTTADDWGLPIRIVSSLGPNRLGSEKDKWSESSWVRIIRLPAHRLSARWSYPPPLGNFADIPYLKEQSFLHRIRDVCTL